MKKIKCSPWRGDANCHLFPSSLDLGDAYIPWYFIKDHGEAPRDTNMVCFLMEKRDLERDPKEIEPTTFDIDVRGSYREHFSPEDLKKSIQEKGQLQRILCVNHKFCFTSNPKPPLMFDPELAKTHCYEGHHRLICCEDLGINVKVTEFDFLTLDTTKSGKIDLDMYHHLYGPEYWSPFQTDHDKKPWFSYSDLENQSKTHKYGQLKKCFGFLKDKINVSSGIDFGCAEGAYTFMANKELGIPMFGFDSELGRVVRPMIYTYNQDREIPVNFGKFTWDEDRAFENDHDFFMALSIVHHMEDQKGFIRRLGQNFSAGIIEVRVRGSVENVTNQGSIKKYDTEEVYVSELKKAFPNVQYIDCINDRKFYVVWS